MARSRSGRLLPPAHPLLLVLTLALFPLGCEPSGDIDHGVEEPETTNLAAAPHDTAVMVVDAPFATPESVLHDEEADVYLVSNIGGNPLGPDDDGFISRVSPDGTVDSLRWIDGARGDFTLNAPKGMAIHGNTLFVADIDSVRAFDRTTGAYQGARGVPGATFLNDLTVGPDGTLYVSDSGLTSSFASSGTDAIHRFDGEEAVPVAEGTELNSPNGIVAWDDSLAVVSFGGAGVRVIPLGGDAEGQNLGAMLTTLAGDQLDGIVRLDDGSFLVSSWGTQTIYRVPPPGSDREPYVVAAGIPSPADIGWDAQRQRLLVPVFQENRLEFHPVHVSDGSGM